MRLLVVSTEFPPGPGGIGTHAFELSRHLVRRGWDVSVLAAQDYVSADEGAAFNAAQSFPVLPWRRLPVGPLGVVWRLRTLRACIRRRRPRLVVASGGRAVLLTALACRGIPWVAVVHGTEFGRGTGWMARALRLALREASAIICVSEYTRGLMRQFGVQARVETVIPNGADPGLFRVLSEAEIGRARRELGLPAGRCIVTVGHVTERKAQDVVVRALPRILERVSDVHYLVMGLPTRGRELCELAASLGVADRVHVIGRVRGENLAGALNASEVFVLTSRRTEAGDVEGFGIAVVEAALCGLPAVVSKGSGLTEAIREGRTGLSVAPDDPEETARAVLELLGSDSRRREMGEQARLLALSEQTWASRIERYDELLGRLAGRVGPRTASREAAVGAS